MSGICFSSYLTAGPSQVPLLILLHLCATKRGISRIQSLDLSAHTPSVISFRLMLLNTVGVLVTPYLQLRLLLHLDIYKTFQTYIIKTKLLISVTHSKQLLLLGVAKPQFGDVNQKT